MSTSTLNNATETVRGIVHRTFFSAPTFSAGLLRTDDGQFVRFRGKFCAVEGDALALVGRWMKDPKYGRQFDAEGLSYDLPETHDGLVQYLATHPAIEGGDYHIDFNGDGCRKVDPERLQNIQLAYCLTAHRAQGSEFPCVVVVCHKSHFFADRNWLYTAVTRAAKTCVILGDRWGLKHAAAKNNTIKRRTLLSLWAAPHGETRIGSV